jgi:hypothetical protein
MAAAVDTSGVGFTWPTGFTQLAKNNLTLDGETVGWAWKRATGSEGTTFTLTLDATRNYSAAVVTFDGRHATDPPVAGTVTLNNSGNTSPVSATAPAVTAVSGDDLVYLCGLDTDGSNRNPAFAMPAGMTERADVTFGFSALGVATQDNVSAGSTGTKTATVTLSAGSTAWAAGLVRIPAAAGGGGGLSIPVAMHHRRQQGMC